jgi:hypothetical protein
VGVLFLVEDILYFAREILGQKRHFGILKQIQSAISAGPRHVSSLS